MRQLKLILILFTCVLLRTPEVLAESQNWDLPGIEEFSGSNCNSDEACTRLFSCYLDELPVALGLGADVPTYEDRLQEMLTLTRETENELMASFQQYPFKVQAPSWELRRRFELNLISGEPNNPPPLSCQNQTLSDPMIGLIETETATPNQLKEKGYDIRIDLPQNTKITLHEPLLLAPESQVNGQDRDFLFRSDRKTIFVKAPDNTDPCGIIINSSSRVILKNLEVSGFATGICVKSGQVVLDGVRLTNNDVGISFQEGRPSGANVLIRSQITNNIKTGVHLMDKSPLVVMATSITSNGASFQFDAGQDTKILLLNKVQIDPETNQELTNIIGSPVIKGMTKWSATEPGFKPDQATYGNYLVETFGESIIPIYLSFAPKRDLSQLNAGFELAIHKGDNVGPLEVLRRAGYKHVPANGMHYATIDIIGKREDPSLRSSLEQAKSRTLLVNYLPAGKGPLELPYVIVKAIDDADALRGDGKHRTIGILPINYSADNTSAIKLIPLKNLSGFQVPAPGDTKKATPKVERKPDRVPELPKK